MKLFISQEHIDKARKARSTEMRFFSCPIAQALKELTNTQFNVGNVTIHKVSFNFHADHTFWSKSFVQDADIRTVSPQMLEIPDIPKEFYKYCED